MVNHQIVNIFGFTSHGFTIKCGELIMPLAYQPLANTNGNRIPPIKMVMVLWGCFSCQVRMDIQDLASFFMDKRVLRVMVPRLLGSEMCG